MPGPVWTNRTGTSHSTVFCSGTMTRRGADVDRQCSDNTQSKQVITGTKIKVYVGERAQKRGGYVKMEKEDLGTKEMI